MSATALLHLVAADSDWRVRFEVARRTDDGNLLAKLAAEEDPMVREAAAQRCNECAPQPDAARRAGQRDFGRGERDGTWT